ncbi:hypothetical protein OPV22_030161 [Ensete ventricosum]|uniref:Transmembrane protein n=1 Tax=Ensete ventricosum TaxID=4639 RepID=A0AAV8Q809_ENSVE|nr:hypothetical protein OPV22_030161 [Ensete ventricosum]
MDKQISVDRDVLVDLESGMNTVINQQEEAKDVDCSAGQGRRVLDKEWSGFLGIDGFMKHEEAVKLENGMPGCAELPVRNAEASVDKRVGGDEWVRLLEEKVGAEKMKKKGCKKHPKPPRPPKSLSLDAADQKLIREISELSMMKRARTERMKKKMRNAKSTSSTGNFFALIVTILFCLVIIWQGAFSQGSSTVRSHGSPESLDIQVICKQEELDDEQNSQDSNPNPNPAISAIEICNLP